MSNDLNSGFQFSINHQVYISVIGLLTVSDRFSLNKCSSLIGSFFISLAARLGCFL